MKKKGFTYLLLALLIAVWGYAIQRILVAVKTNDSNIPSFTKRANSVSLDVDYYTWSDSMPISLDYRDPILSETGTRISTKTLGEEENTENFDAFASTEQYFVPEPDPEVRYLGFIQNEKNKKPVAIIEIQGEQKMISRNDQVGEIKVIHIAPDNIKIVANGQTKTIFK